MSFLVFSRRQRRSVSKQWPSVAVSRQKHKRVIFSVKTSIDEFIKRIAFILPTAKEINYEDRRRLNDIIRENVKTAA